MQLFLMRHGEAEPIVTQDSSRALTEAGKLDVAQQVTALKQDLKVVDTIWASPYIRAQQTASIASEILGQSVITKDFLVPSANPQKVLDELASIESPLLMVSHQPLVGILLDSLTGQEPGCLRMGTSSIASLSSDIWAKGCSELSWLKHIESNQ